MSKFLYSFFTCCVASIDTITARAVSMTPQIQSLLDEKQQKIEQLEKSKWFRVYSYDSVFENNNLYLGVFYDFCYI